jgi:hypothetical protein
MAPSTFFGLLAFLAATVCFVLGGPDGIGAGAVLLLVGAVWLLGPARDFDGEDDL